MVIIFNRTRTSGRKEVWYFAKFQRLQIYKSLTFFSFRSPTTFIQEERLKIFCVSAYIIYRGRTRDLFRSHGLYMRRGALDIFPGSKLGIFKRGESRFSPASSRWTPDFFGPAYKFARTRFFFYPNTERDNGLPPKKEKNQKYYQISWTVDKKVGRWRSNFSQNFS